MITDIDAKLLEKIADLTGKPVGAFNIRKDSGCEARQSTEHIEISPKTDGKQGIDIRIKAGTKGEQCHIPVIISKTGLSELVYNDFYVGDDCDVEIVAGCGIHNSGCNESRHDGVHTFYIGKNSRVHYSEKHYGEDAPGETGRNVMNPQTIVHLGENSTMQMDTVQIRGIDSTKRDTRFYCEKGSEVVVTERLLTHGKQEAESDMHIELNGEDAKGRVISRSVAQDDSKQVFHPVMVGNSQCFGHVQCDSIIMGHAHIESIPAITANCPDAQLIHEAAIGKIAGDQLLKLETLGTHPGGGRGDHPQGIFGVNCYPPTQKRRLPASSLLRFSKNPAKLAVCSGKNNIHSRLRAFFRKTGAFSAVSSRASRLCRDALALFSNPVHQCIKIPHDLIALGVLYIDIVRLVKGQAHGKVLGLVDAVGFKKTRYSSTA